MYKGFIGWAKEPDKTEVKYIVEMIRDEEVWNKFLETEDIDLYEKQEFNDTSVALQYYFAWYVSKECYDIKMWQQVYINGEMILEEFIEPKGSLKYFMRLNVNREMKERMDSAERELIQVRKENELMNGFIKAMGKQFQDMFKEYCEKEIKKNE